MTYHWKLLIYLIITIKSMSSDMTTTSVVELNTERPTITNIKMESYDQIKIEWNANRPTTVNTRYVIRVVNSNTNEEFEWPAQIQFDENDISGSFYSIKRDSAFDCFSRCISDPSCKRVARLHPKIDPTMDCYFKNNSIFNQSKSVDSEFLVITDYKDEAIINNLPYGDIYKFKVGIIDNREIYYSNLSTTDVDLRITWKPPVITRIGFERISLDWRRNDDFVQFVPARISFIVNESLIEYPRENYQWIDGLIKPNYYELNGWTNPHVFFNTSEIDCKNLCIQNATCLFAIHFYRDQYQMLSADTRSRKPLNAKANTCILRSGLKIQSATKKDNSTNILYLTPINSTSIKHEFDISLNKTNLIKLKCLTPYGSSCDSSVYNQSFSKIEIGHFDITVILEMLRVKLKWTLTTIPKENLSRYKIISEYSLNETISSELVSSVFDNEVEMDLMVNTDICHRVVLIDKFNKESAPSNKKCQTLINFDVKVKGSSQNAVFIETERAELECNYTGKAFTDSSFTIDQNAIGAIFWYKDDALIEAASQLNITINKEKLIFNYLSKTKHEGAYSCKVLLKNEQLIKSDKFQLEVRKASCNRQMESTLSKIDLSKENRVMLSWNASDFNPDNSKSLKIKITKNGNNHAELDVEQSPKLIEDLSMNTYYCFTLIAANKLDIVTTTSNTVCSFFPLVITITSTRESFIETQSAQLSCEHSELQKEFIDKIVWTRDDMEITYPKKLNMTMSNNNKRITIDRIKKETHGGIYKCNIYLNNSQVVSSSEFKVMVISINFELEFRANVTQDEVSLNEYDPLNLTCSVNTETNYLLEIHHNSIPMVISTGSKLYLYFDKIDRNNKGAYVCYVKMDGQVLAEKKLDVKVIYQTDSNHELLFIVASGVGGLVVGAILVVILVAVLVKRNQGRIFKKEKKVNKQFEFNKTVVTRRNQSTQEEYYDLSEEYSVPKTSSKGHEAYAQLSK